MPSKAKTNSKKVPFVIVLQWNVLSTQNFSSSLRAFKVVGKNTIELKMRETHLITHHGRTIFQYTNVYHTDTINIWLHDSAWKKTHMVICLVTSAHRGRTVTIGLSLVCLSSHPSICHTFSGAGHNLKSNWLIVFWFNKWSSRVDYAHLEKTSDLSVIQII